MNLVTLGQTVWASAGGPKNYGGAGPLSIKTRDISDPQKHVTLPCVTMLNLLALDQTVSASVGGGVPKKIWSCTASFGPRSFSSSGPTACNNMPARLCNLDLSLGDFRRLLKTALFQTVPV